MQQSNIMFALPREIMELQLSAVDLLSAMYPSPSELSISPDNHLSITQLRSWIDDEKALPSSTVPQILTLALNLSVSGAAAAAAGDGKDAEQDATDEPRHIQLNISVPLQSADPEPVEPPPWKWGIRQPDWMSRAQVADLSAPMPSDDIFSAIDYIQDHAPAYVQLASTTAPTTAATTTATNGSGDPLARVWFYFPSLSTREKRDDLVNNAPHYSLTGFVLAGKPGVLCLEGTSRDVDDYMKFIKTESWGDIPSHQKKVSERYREEGGAGGRGVERKFEGMREITDSLGERRGERANRGDMKALELWLKGMGLGEAFEKVIM